MKRVGRAAVSSSQGVELLCFSSSMHRSLGQPLGQLAGFLMEQAPVLRESSLYRARGPYLLIQTRSSRN